MSLSYLWLREQAPLIDEMIACGLHAEIVKVCCMGLKPIHLGKTIAQLKPYFDSLHTKFGFNVAGEGGEYESAVFDCPLFKTHKVVAAQKDIVIIQESLDDPVAYHAYSGLDIVEKT